MDCASGSRGSWPFKGADPGTGGVAGGSGTERGGSKDSSGSGSIGDCRERARNGACSGSRGSWVFKGAALAAVAASLLLTVHDLTGAFAFVEAAPLYAYGFAWLLPSLIGGVAGALLGRRFDSAASG